MYRLYLIALSAVGMMCMIAVMFVPRGDAAPPPPPPALASAKPVIKGDPEALLLRRDKSGQFHIEAAVNGNAVNFLVDTGADMLALTEEQASQLGLNVSPSDFEPVMQTASGTGYGAAVHLDEVEVAGTRLHDVEAVVVKGLTINLLGQSVLRQLGGVELKGDNMIIRSQ